MRTEGLRVETQTGTTGYVLTVIAKGSVTSVLKVFRWKLVNGSGSPTSVCRGESSRYQDARSEGRGESEEKEWCRHYTLCLTVWVPLAFEGGFPDSQVLTFTKGRK